MADVLAPLRVKPERVNDEDWSSKRWMPDDKEGFVLGLLVSQSGDSAVVTRQDTKQQLTVKAADLERVNPPKFNKIEDMTNMAVLNPPSVLFNLKDRYYADLIYTYSGLFCIVVNPYKSLPIYTPEIVQAYKGQKRADLPPHVFAVADEAYRSMLQDNENQSILCTGESGAGKTENTKKVIQYLASVALGGSSRRAARTVTEAARRRKSSIGLSKDALGQGELERQLLEANPVLETFGNARTVKNDNSSRFGKFIKIHFDSSGSIMGATINTYLLEKSRAVLQNNDERNFHGFYQLLRGASPELKKELLLSDVNSYRFITNGDKPKPANIDDAKEYQNTNGSLKVMGFTDDEIKSVWRTISAVLMFGQLKFEEDRKEQAFFQGSNDIDAQKLCQLLGIDIAKFTRALLKPETKAGGNTINLSVSKKKAEFTTEALAKATYERLFLYIVKRINDVLNTREVKKFIGILDIAGFEIFQINSFEQLCINFTNEKLQQLFNTRFFFLEQKIYQDEEIAWEDIDFSGLDLKSTIDLIENKTGVLALLDEQCFFPRANDKTLLDKFVEILGKHPKFAKPGPREEGTFGIVHYAGKVTYTVNQWLDKNKDPLNDNVTELLENSSDKLIGTLWGQDMTSNFTGGRKGNFRTVGNIYKEQLTSLVDMLTTTTSHFVRCIIPNHQKRAGLIDGHLVWEQLRCNGVLEGIRICRSGFPSRWPFQEFRQRFSILCPDAVPKSAGFIEGKRAVELMVAALQLPAEMFRIGRTKAFFKNDTIDDLERQRDAKLTTMILRFQARCRGYIVRRVTNNGPQYRAAVEIIQRNARAYLKLRSWPWWNLFTKIKPLIKGAAQDEELRVLREDVQKWKDKFEREEKLRIEAEGQVDMLHEEKRRLEEQLRAENDALREAAAIRERLNTRKIELENDNQELETQLQEQIDTSAKLLEEKRTLTSQLTEIKQDLQKSNVNEARISRLEAQLTEAKEKFDRQMKEAADLEESRAKLDKELRDLQSQLDDVSAAKAKLERAKTKLQGELDDLSASRDKDVAQVAALEKKQRQFDTQIKDFKIQIDQAGADRDSAQAEVRQLQTTVLSLKNEINSLTDRADSAEKAKKRLQIELDEVMEKKDDRSLAEIENAKRELQRQVDEQRQTILELEDEVHLAEKAKQGLEVTLHALEEKMASMNVGASEEEENKRRALQRQVKEMEEEIEAERRSKTKIQNEKRKLETDVKALQEQLDEETRNHQKDAALLKKLEKKVKLLDSAMAGDGLLGEATSVEMEKLRKKIREYKQELNDAEDQISKANLSKRKAERELEEHMQMTSTYEAEINQLRAQIRRLKNKDEPFDLSLLESPPKGATSVTVKITEKVTRRDDEDV